MDLETPLKLIESREPAKLEKAVALIEGIILSRRREFIKSQDLFATNIAGRLVLQLDTVLASEYPQQTCISYLRLVRGCCLLHRPSRGVFNTNEVLLTIVNKGILHTSSEVQEQALYVLVAALVRQVSAIRRFEELGVLKTVCTQFKNPRTAKSVKLAILQFLFFYLVPETQFPDLERTTKRKSTFDKQQVLGRYLSNVDGLVRELETNQPFGKRSIEW